MIVSPSAKAPNIKERWDMDLSPGTRTVPFKGPDRVDFKGMMFMPVL